jgi:ribonuclease P protein component
MRKKYRVKKEREFQTVFQEGASFANRKFVVYRLEPSGQKHFRVGLSVGKKVGNAVARNQVKRQIRSVLQELKSDLPPIYFIFIARPATKDMPNDEMRSNLIHVLKLAKILS